MTWKNVRLWLMVPEDQKLICGMEGKHVVAYDRRLPPLISLITYLYSFYTLKGVFAKNERGYRLNAIKMALLIATNLTSICCVYKEKLVTDISYRIT